MCAVRWVSEKTGRVVSQVEPNAVVRLEIDGPAGAREAIRVVEEPEPTLRSILGGLGRKTRRLAHEALPGLSACRLIGRPLRGSIVARMPGLAVDAADA